MTAQKSLKVRSLGRSLSSRLFYDWPLSRSLRSGIFYGRPLIRSLRSLFFLRKSEPWADETRVRATLADRSSARTEIQLCSTASSAGDTDVPRETRQECTPDSPDLLQNGSTTSSTLEFQKKFDKFLAGKKISSRLINYLICSANKLCTIYFVFHLFTIFHHLAKNDWALQKTKRSFA